MKCNMNYRDSYRYADPGLEREECKVDPKPHPKDETETILRCGTSVGSTPLCCNTPVPDGGVAWNATVLATVALNTSNVIDPAVKLDFSSLISFKTRSDDNYFLRLVFKLSKICGCSPIPLGTWTFEKIHHENNGVLQINGEYVQETDSFCFSWCGCGDCPDCCRYIVEVVEQQCCNIDFVAVSNIVLSALGVGLKKVQ